jgi:2-keto-4-pentenoate hydratase/2-oxohepta-3-ene-1,7-dioic acid hydratase in catechol pathway
MKIVRYEYGGRAQYGELKGEEITPLEGEFANFKSVSGAKPLSLNAVKLLAPSTPSKIVAVGPNYRAHLRAGVIAPPPRPFYWLKPSTAVINPNEQIVIPKDVPMICHESELAIVIGKRASKVSVANAKNFIFGYTCLNDVTAGVLTNPPVFQSSQYFVDGKICDTFAPMGPHIETDLDTSDLQLRCRINGEVRQDHRTSDMIWPCTELFSLISHVITLLPGDVISTGSPPGVGPISAGDRIEVEVQGIGILRNSAVSAE